ncbi:MAG: hypothetical protein KDL87_14570, partial [Verrucomicrobiae bacterium]|nr:hypothetical protein [Verrucomicrobiae bacterium]
MDGGYVPSTWGNYDLVRGKLDTRQYRGKTVLASESWIVWDSSGQATDVNGDGAKDERDAYDKAVTILGRCLERGLNTLNLPWSDNSSAWAMGLTKRRDYNGRIKTLRPDIVIPANDDGPDIVSRKVSLRGSDTNYTIADGEGYNFTIQDYINPPDPNHLHYYVWRWYAEIAGGSDEVIRHAMAGERGNDIVVSGPGFTGAERYRIAAYNRTKRSFIVLIYSGGANRKAPAKVTIPSRIVSGFHYNNGFSPVDFRGEGFADGDQYHAFVTTKDISREDGRDLETEIVKSPVMTVSHETLTIPVERMNRFTTIEFIKTAK